MHIAINALCPMSLSARLIQLRHERNWTQQDVAEQVGLHVNQVKRYESGSAQPSLDGLKKLAKAFSVSTDWLLFEDAERGPSEDLRLQFEALGQFSAEELSVARAVIESLILRHMANRFNRRVEEVTPPSPPMKTAASKASARKPSKAMARS